MDEAEVINQVSTYLSQYGAGLMREPKICGNSVFYLTNCHMVIACKSTGLVDEDNAKELDTCVRHWQVYNLKQDKEAAARWHRASIDDEKVCLWEWAAMRSYQKGRRMRVLHPARLIGVHCGDITTNLNWLFDAIIRHRYMMGHLTSGIKT